MINKKLLSFDRGALRFVGANVAFQWLGMLCNVIFVRAIARLVGAAFAGMLTTGVLWQNLLLCLGTVPFRFVFTLLASGMSDQASKNVKRTLRSNIYDKLTRLGPNYTETAATSEVVMLASEGVEQIDTYFAKYLPQLVYSLLAPARAGKPVLYRAYSCREGAYLPVQQLAAQPLVILEGSYSHHPLLAPYEDFRVFMTCSDAEQTRRLQAREGDRYPDFAARWIPLEEAYFTQHNIEDAADFVMDTTTD